MKNLLLILLVVYLTSCHDNTPRSEHTYHIKNNLNQMINFIGLSQGDTIFNEEVLSNEQFEFYKVDISYSYDIQAKVEIDKSDSIFVYIKDSLYYKIENIPGDNYIDYLGSLFLNEAESDDAESHWVKDNKNNPDIDYVFIVE